MRRTLGSIIAVLLLALTVTACNGGDDPETKPSKTPTTHISTPPSTKELALKALKTYLEARDEILRGSSKFKDEASLRKHLAETVPAVSAGAEQKRLRGYVLDDYADRVVTKGKWGHDIRRAQRGKDGFLVRECEDRSGVSRTQDGKQLPDLAQPDGTPAPNPLLIEYTVSQNGSGWVVSNKNILLEGKC